MNAFWIILGYLLIRVFFDLLRLGITKGFSKFSPGQFISSFLIFSFMVFLIYLESTALNEILMWEFSTAIALIYSTLTFVFGYEFSNYLFNKFNKDMRLREKQKLNFKVFILYFVNSIFGIIFSIIATIILIFF